MRAARTALIAGLRFGLILHHTDADREWAYDRQSPVGKLDQALDAAVVRGWTVVDMKKDWKQVFAFESTAGAQRQALPITR